MQKSEQFPKALNSLRSYRMLENFRAVFSSLPSRLRGSGSRKQIDYSYLEAFCAGEVYPETDPVEWFCYHKQFNILRSSPLARTNDKRHLASQVSPHILTSHTNNNINNNNTLINHKTSSNSTINNNNNNNNNTNDNSKTNLINNYINNSTSSNKIKNHNNNNYNINNNSRGSNNYINTTTSNSCINETTTTLSTTTTTPPTPITTK
ncbi:unnamed protein product [Nesidiocoris tenuis]|uniref:Uncharacterized protein n=1 Tax=Nesidiocoris tenuis TaxID=355587 RepID=A0A6H5FYP3_9HEMI|nr:unnamed protein product [Nesidiocoris tenuis]